MAKLKEVEKALHEADELEKKKLTRKDKIRNMAEEFEEESEELKELLEPIEEKKK